MTEGLGFPILLIASGLTGITGISMMRGLIWGTTESLYFTGLCLTVLSGILLAAMVALCFDDEEDGAQA